MGADGGPVEKEWAGENARRREGAGEEGAEEEERRRW
jgi:hypothetical protein